MSDHLTLVSMTRGVDSETLDPVLHMRVKLRLNPLLDDMNQCKRDELARHIGEEFLKIAETR